MKKWLITVLVSMGVATGVAQAAGDAAAGQARAAVCIACHGPDGNSPNPVWPKLASQHPSYIKKQLTDFKAGVRTDPMMAPMAAPLTDADIDNLAAYFSSQKQAAGVAAAEQAQLGEKLYRGGNRATGLAACMACHGPSGLGNPAANYPRISGQHAAYLTKALKDFRAGTRANDMNKMMQGVAAKMTDAEITAVAQYIQGLQ